MFCLTACDLSSPSSSSKHTHDYSEIGYDSTSHWYYCGEDNIKKEGSKENHYDSNDDGYCDICSFDMSDVHVHDYSVYDYDSECHWKACSECRSKDPSDTKENHFDDDVNGECDVCGRGMPLPLEENISFVFEMGGYDKVLRIEGAKPSGAETVKLRYYDKDNPENGGFISNGAVLDSSYIFLIGYDKLTYTDDYSPVYIFDLYSYTTQDSEPQITKIKNKNYLEYTYYKNSIGGKTYWHVLSLSGENFERLAIKPEAVRDFAVTDIRLEEKENNLYMYVSAIGPKELECVKLVASLSKNNNFIDDTSENLGKFEFCVNLSSFDEGYITFSLYEYSDKNPSDLNDCRSSYVLSNNSKLRSGESVIIGDKQYTVSVSSRDVVSIKITPPSFTITKISLKVVDSKPCLLISAISPTTLSGDDVIIKASPYGNGGKSEEIKSTETNAGKFEFCLDLSTFRDCDMKWIKVSYGMLTYNEKKDINEYVFTDIDPSSLMSEEEIVVDGYKYYNYDSGDVGSSLKIYISEIIE